MLVKAVILIGGNQKGKDFLVGVIFRVMSSSFNFNCDMLATKLQKINYILGTRFRPLSLDLPKPLFAVAGFPIIQHHIEACVQIPFLKEIIILGYYGVNEMSQFVGEMVQLYKLNIRWQND